MHGYNTVVHSADSVCYCSGACLLMLIDRYLLTC